MIRAFLTDILSDAESLLDSAKYTLHGIVNETIGYGELLIDLALEKINKSIN